MRERRDNAEDREPPYGATPIEDALPDQPTNGDSMVSEGAPVADDSPTAETVGPVEKDRNLVVIREAVEGSGGEYMGTYEPAPVDGR